MLLESIFLDYICSTYMKKRSNIYLSLFYLALAGETKCLELLEEERKPKAKTSSDILDDDTVLVAARNGIVEIVNEILTQFISVFYTTNSQEENILLVAVRNKKPLVVENLRKKFQKEYPEVWNTLTLAVNKDGKTMLHMAAYASEEYKPWQISGSALQLMWDVNWFQV